MITKLILDRQASAQTFSFGTTSAAGEGLVTINKGTQAASFVVLDVKGSQNIAGDLNLIGNLNITGSINETAVTNLAVQDINITLNKNGTTAGAAGGGLFIEGDAAATIGKFLYDGTLTSKWKLGDGTTQVEVVTISGAQTLTNKTIGGGQITGNISGNAANVTGTVAVGNGGTGATTLTGVIIGNGTSAFTTKTNPTGAFVGDTDTQTLTNKTLTTPKIAQINDVTNNLASLLFLAPASSVNQMTVTGAIAGAAPSLSATGTDTNISLNLVPKGSGVLQSNGVDVVTISGTQTLTNKTIAGTQISGNISGNAANVTGTVAVSNGGTGVTTTTAYGIITGGTTATGAFQNAGTGTTGQVLTSNGASALPTWQAAGAPSMYFRRIALTGLQNSSNKAFTYTGNNPLTGTDMVTFNGAVLNPSSSLNGGNDYFLDTATKTITFDTNFTAPAATDTILFWGVV